MLKGLLIVASIALAPSAVSVEDFNACVEEAQIVANILAARDRGMSLETFIAEFIKPEFRKDAELRAYLKRLWTSPLSADEAVKKTFYECIGQ